MRPNFMLNRKWLPRQWHPDPGLQPFWDVTQFAVLLLPFSSLLSSVAISLVALILLQRKFRPIARRPVNRSFAILAGLMLLSTALAYRRTDALLGLANFLPFLIVFAALSEVLQTPAQLRRLAWILVLGSVPVVVIGFGQQFWGWSGRVQLPGSLVDWMIYPTGNPPGRMASVFFSANVLASYLVVTLTLGLGLLAEARVGERGSGGAGGKIWRWLALGTIVLGNAAALVLTNSRNAWAIAVFSCLAFAVYLGWRWLLWAVTGVVGTILAAAFAPSPLRDWLRAIVPAFFWARLTDELYPNRPIADVRTTQWQFAWSLTQQRPWTGWGLRNFSPLYQEAMNFFIGHPHNLPLMLAAEIGLPATLLFLGSVGWVVGQGSWQLLRWSSLSPGEAAGDRLICFTFLTAFLGCSLFNLLDITLFDVRINLLGWLLLASIAGVVYRLEAIENPMTDL